MEKDFEKKLLKGNLEFKSKLFKESKDYFINGEFPKYPILIHTSMDPRINVHEIFQLNSGDVFILRNAGNVYSIDVMRSILLAISEFKIKYIIILGHLDSRIAKIKINNLKDNLNPNLIYHICEGSKDSQESLKKFFKIFRDEIKNIDDFVRFLRNFPDFPEDLKIIGMLYDVYSGWIFESSKLEKFKTMKNFLLNYQALLRDKNYDLTTYIKNLELKNNISKKPKVNHISNLEQNNNSFHSKKKDLKNKVKSKIYNPKRIAIKSNKYIESLNNKTPVDNFFNFNFKINIPKVKLPKININIPQIKFKNDFRKVSMNNRIRKRRYEKIEEI